MQLELQDRETEHRLSLTGSPDGESASACREALIGLPHDRPIVLDASSLEHWDLALLQVVLAWLKEYADRPRPLILSPASSAEQLRLLGLQTLGLEEIFHAH